MREQYSIRLALAIGALTLVVTVFFAFFQSPGLLDLPEKSVVKSAAAIPHLIKGRDNCTRCHGLSGGQPYPVKHAGWSDGSCPQCHRPGTASAGKEETKAVPANEKGKEANPLPHPVEGMEECGACHGPGGEHPYPEDHAGRAEAGCTACHAAQENIGEGGK